MSLSFVFTLRPMVAAGALLTAFATPALAEQIVVSNYGVSANGMPFAVAMEKGFFKEEGADVTGILSSAGGGTTLRNMLAGDAPYAEVNPNAVFAALQKGADIKIVSDNVLTVAEFVWAVKPDSPIHSPKDLTGRKIGYTNPRSTSQALATLVLQAGDLKPHDAELVKTGGFGEGIPALDMGLIDVAPIPEPLWSKYKTKYRPIAKASELLPPIANVVGVAAGDASPEKAAFISAVIRARRKAVDYMKAHPDESATIIAQVYNLDPAVARSAVENLVGATTAGLPYWGSGQIHMEGLTRAVDVQKMVGALSGDVDVKGAVDTRYLPDDIKAIK
ncbi:NitT/TauT family transport system substrate-binding protein [Azospirillum oryzae]|uniref:NitT/TauT family transport system substrate-binding protein n=1 Tax=Azospirillum oryzae TaxID=286727 RepID=A0A1X7HMM2_9PROT|nr:ABC transporter substrate-binding protein [Azospirillum oryzae]SMF88615.1 NitT/TauT family transport system substrate-binding protein [Azospirillum oryzae]